MGKHLSLPVLVLNSGWQPTSISSVRDAITKVAAEQSRFLDDLTYNLYDLEEWMNLEIPEGKEGIRLPRGNLMRIPEILISRNYDKFPEQEVKFTPYNLLVRDGFRCQYSGKILTKDEATIDHVIPKSKGGVLTWDNAVIASVEANRKKANRTPAEAGMPLLKTPSKPTWNPVYGKFARLTVKSKIPQSWRKFIPNNWNVEIGEDVDIEE